MGSEASTLRERSRRLGRAKALLDALDHEEHLEAGLAERLLTTLRWGDQAIAMFPLDGSAVLESDTATWRRVRCRLFGSGQRA